MMNVLTFGAVHKMMVDSGVYSSEVVVSAELAHLEHGHNDDAPCSASWCSISHRQDGIDTAS